MFTPAVSVPNVPAQFTPLIPPGSPLLGTGHARPLRKISSSPEIGTVVIHVLVVVSNVVEVQLTLGENVIAALGTGRLYDVPAAVNAMLEFVSVTVAPVLGIPPAL